MSLVHRARARHGLITCYHYFSKRMRNENPIAFFRNVPKLPQRIAFFFLSRVEYDNLTIRQSRFCDLVVTARKLLHHFDSRCIKKNFFFAVSNINEGSDSIANLRNSNSMD